jgi:hypothetical protein
MSLIRPCPSPNGTDNEDLFILRHPKPGTSPHNFEYEKIALLTGKGNPMTTLAYDQVDNNVSELSHWASKYLTQAQRLDLSKRLTGNSAGFGNPHVKTAFDSITSHSPEEICGMIVNVMKELSRELRKQIIEQCSMLGNDETDPGSTNFRKERGDDSGTNPWTGGGGRANDDPSIADLHGNTDPEMRGSNIKLSGKAGPAMDRGLDEIESLLARIGHA